MCVVVGIMWLWVSDIDGAWDSCGRVVMLI